MITLRRKGRLCVAFEPADSARVLFVAITNGNKKKKKYKIEQVYGTVTWCAFILYY